jgi:hypothetical protein
MKKRFRFTVTNLRALSANPAGAKATELEFCDTEVVRLKCLSGKTWRTPTRGDSYCVIPPLAERLL